jgi:hypothetical protein
MVETALDLYRKAIRDLEALAEYAPWLHPAATTPAFRNGFQIL